MTLGDQLNLLGERTAMWRPPEVVHCDNLRTSLPAGAHHDHVQPFLRDWAARRGVAFQSVVSGQIPLPGRRKRQHGLRREDAEVSTRDSGQARAGAAGDAVQSLEWLEEALYLIGRDDGAGVRDDRHRAAGSGRVLMSITPPWTL